ncbi:MAG: uncharacterized protein KVP18_002199 [Porospora cf. gigantea A]|uniref:uncharacterized protein n=1 Tax=Porospora cf. gigantea A TaxID=2853593 RepID=UPI003559D691|nr:MAG: hypothetical protein KVP18_002199 [Porospora cf. gigantea A]
MQNDQGKLVDLYVPRKCSATGKLIPAFEHGAVQLSVGLVNEQGVYDGNIYSFTVSGAVRGRGDADNALNRLFQEKSLLEHV